MPITHQLESLKIRVQRGDPLAICEALQICSVTQVGMPHWLVDQLMSVIADFSLGNKPSWKKVGMRPLSIFRRRIEDDVRRRAVESIRAWKDDKQSYDDMPRRCIKALFKGRIKHEHFQTMEDVLRLARFGLRGLRIETSGPLLKCSPRTLRRAYEAKTPKVLPRIPSAIALTFGLNDPNSFFGGNEPPPDGFRF